MELLYFAGIRSNQLFWLEKPRMVPVQYQGRGRKPNEDTVKPDTAAQAAIQIASIGNFEMETGNSCRRCKGSYSRTNCSFASNSK